jgi:hypothetical protein
VGVPWAVLDLLEKLVKYRTEGDKDYDDVMYEFFIFLFNLGGLSRVGDGDLNDALQEFRALETAARLKDLYFNLSKIETPSPIIKESVDVLAICICRFLDEKEIDISYGPILEKVHSISLIPDDDNAENAGIAWNKLRDAEIILANYLNSKK